MRIGVDGDLIVVFVGCALLLSVVVDDGLDVVLVVCCCCALGVVTGGFGIVLGGCVLSLFVLSVRD